MEVNQERFILIKEIEMKILTDKYLEEYKKLIQNLELNFENFLINSRELNFEYLTESSSVYSSNIEGNSLDLNSFMNNKVNKTSNKDVEEINNLIKAYEFAQNNSLSEKKLLKVHEISSETILIKYKRGRYREDKVGVFGNEGLIYLAIEAEFLEKEISYLFLDIKLLLEKELTKSEVFYYASQIHLRFVHIHPFSDGNGRTARLLEKWFLVEKLGKELWKINSERFYKENRDLYYKNINLGVNYYELNYNKSINFLLMLEKSLTIYNLYKKNGK